MYSRKVSFGFCRQLGDPKTFWGAHMCLEVSPKNPNQVVPVMDLGGWKVVELGSGDVRQKQGQVMNGEIVVVCAS